MWEPPTQRKWVSVREREWGMRVVCAPLQLLLNEISKRFFWLLFFYWFESRRASDCTVLCVFILPATLKYTYICRYTWVCNLETFLLTFMQSLWISFWKPEILSKCLNPPTHTVVSTLHISERNRHGVALRASPHITNLNTYYGSCIDISLLCVVVYQ